ncbi:MAG: hypothetical protein ACYC6I_11740 [Bacillota bacterium]
MEGDAEAAVTWAFYTYENCIAAVAEKLGVKWKRTHVSKVEVAKRLHAQGILSVDVGAKLEELNVLRKCVQYGEPTGELKELNLEELSSDLERFVDEVEAVIRGE